MQPIVSHPTWKPSRLLSAPGRGAGRSIRIEGITACGRYRMGPFAQQINRLSTRNPMKPQATRKSVSNTDDPPREPGPVMVMARRCHGCGTLARPTERFCPCCGDPLRPLCPHCGVEVRHAIAFYCSHCGGSLAENTAHDGV